MASLEATGIGLDYIRLRCPDMTPEQHQLLYTYFNTPIKRKCRPATPVVARLPVHFEPRECPWCHEWYEPRSATQRYCPTCQPIRTRERKKAAAAKHYALTKTR